MSLAEQLKNLAKLSTPTIPTDDDLANQEKERAYKDGQAGIILSRHANRIVIVMMYMCSLIIASLAVVWSLHILLPDCRRWLTKEEFQGIERILFSSVLISIGTRYFKKHKVIDN